MTAEWIMTMTLSFQAMMCFGNIQANLSNDGRIEKEYKVEYWLANETCFFAARIISNGIFILMAFWNINVIMAVFAVCLLLLSRELSKLHRIMK